MPAIHVIRLNDPTLPQITLTAPGTNVYQSGNWAVAQETAAALVGGQIYFHRSQIAPSFYGGIIMGYTMVEDEGAVDRVVFTFEYNENCRNVHTPNEGWAREIKIVW